MIKAVAYCRVGPGEEGRVEPVKKQELDIRSYARAQRLELVEVYADESIGVLPSSPTTPMCSLAGITLLLDEAPLKPWVYVIVTEPERLQHPGLSHNPLQALAGVGKKLAHIELDLGLVPTQSGSPKPKRLGPPLPVAQRLLLGRVNGAKQGFHQSGPAPYGYRRMSIPRSDRSDSRKILVIDEEEAMIVRDMFREYLRRRSMKKLIDYLDAQGLTTRRGKRWSRAGVSWILKNETYLGRVHFGKVRGNGHHTAIISQITFNKVQQLIKNNNKRGGAYKSSSYKRLKKSKEPA